MVTGIVIFASIVAVVVLTSLFKNVDMSAKVKNSIAVIISVVAGVLTDLAGRNFDFGSYAAADILGTALIIYGASQLVYTFIMKGTAADAALESVGSPEVTDEEVYVAPPEDEAY